MLRIKIELVPNGNEAKARTLATGTITNNGTGDESSGYYDIRLNRADGKNRKWRTGRVKDFPRLKKSVWYLLKQALNATVP